MDAATTAVFLAMRSVSKIDRFAVYLADSSAAELGYSAVVAWQRVLPTTYGVGGSGSDVFRFGVARLGEMEKN